MIYFSDFAGASAIDGTQGSANAGILAAVYATISGGVVTIVAQKNVASITRHAAGNYRVNYTSALADNNYGLMANGRFADSTADNPTLIQPNRNSTGGVNVFSTSGVDLQCTGAGSATPVEPAQFCCVVFDPDSVGSDYLAAASWTVSGTTVTMQQQTNVSGVSRQATGVYRATFNSALSDADYSEFGYSRYADFTNDSVPLFGQNRNTTGPRDLHSTAALDLCVGRLNTNTSGMFDTGRGAVLVRNSDVAPRGTLAAARFTVSGGVCSLVKSWNVASVTYQTTGCYRLNFTTPLSDTDYAAICSGKWNGFTNDDTPIIGINRNSSASRNVKSTSAVDVVAVNYASSLFDPDVVNIWVLKPALM